MTSNEIRQQFLDFFRSKNHEIVGSSSVVPFDDPTLMFTNAGMNQFKDVFLATGSRPFVRAADTQKCIRAGGKHNDLDDVGQDTYHHTFFEMLGNWSFGDYFKKEAIEWAWELLTDVWKIPKERLHATYFEGDTAEGLEPDSEAKNLWTTVTDIKPENIHPGNKKDNFWEMGDTGPCGPCSEIHIDLTPDISGAPLVNAGDARVIEIWNLVFIQFAASWLPGGKERVNEWDCTSPSDRQATFGETNRQKLLATCRKLCPLPAKHVDTGMGFERLCAVLQGMERGKLGAVTNYDTDVFTPIFEAIRKRTGAPAYTAALPKGGTKGRRDEATEERGDGAGSGVGPASSRCGDDEVMIDVSYRVIADHIRCLTFALTDGAIPSNEGRGYVLRRILRRAVRYGRQYMNMHEPFLCDLVKPIVDHMANAFPELRTAHAGKNIEHVTEIVRDEEESFLKTLERGIKLFEYEAERATALFIGEREYMAGEAMGMPGTRVPIADDQPDPVVIPAGVAFVLHDTYGFPIDLTLLMAEERGMEVDGEGYERLMEEARRKSRGEKMDSWTILAANFASYDLPQTRFVGYDCLESDARITQTVMLEHYGIAGGASFGEFISMGQRGAVVLEETPFYSEKGGQVADVGRIVTPSGTFRVEEVRDFNGVVVHIGRCLDGEIWPFSKLESKESAPIEPESVVGIPIKDLPAELAAKPREVYEDNLRTFRGRTELAHAIVEMEPRRATTQNHTSTHILNWSLREVLGDHVQQKGSLVDPEKTRFDFSHNKPLTGEELSRIETLCNEQIEANHEVFTKEVDQAAARKINTLRAVFGEKYPDHVRVVSIGAPVTEEDAKSVGADDWLLRSPDNPEWMNYSVEFCGGTHLQETKDANRFVLISEEGVAKGVRRLVGVSGEAANKAITLGEELLSEAKAYANLPEPQALACAETPQSQSPRGLKPAAQGADVQAQAMDLATAISALQKKLADAIIPIAVRHEIQDLIAGLQKKAKAQQKKANATSGEAVQSAVAILFENAETIGDVTIVTGEVPAANADALRGAIDWVRNKTDASAVLLASSNDGKVTLVAGMSKDVVKKEIKAGDLIKEICPIVGGKGGGRPDMAQGGGSEPEKIADAVEAGKTWLTKKLG